MKVHEYYTGMLPELNSDISYREIQDSFHQYEVIWARLVGLTKVRNLFI